MMKIIMGLLSVLLLAGCSTYSVPPVEELPILINVDENINAIVDIPFNKTLNSNIPVKWETTPLPSGLVLKDDVITGKPTGLGQVTVVLTTKTKTQTATKTVTFTIVDEVWCNLPEVTITNFHPDATAEYTVEVHNGESIEKETKKVITDSTDIPDSQGLISVPSKLKQTLFGDYSAIKLLSDVKQTLYVSNYDQATNTITINGFLPLTESVIIIEYPAEIWFTVYVSDELVDAYRAGMMT